MAALIKLCQSKHTIQPFLAPKNIFVRGEPILMSCHYLCFLNNLRKCCVAMWLIKWHSKCPRKSSRCSASNVLGLTVRRWLPFKVHLQSQVSLFVFYRWSCHSQQLWCLNACGNHGGGRSGQKAFGGIERTGDEKARWTDTAQQVTERVLRRLRRRGQWCRPLAIHSWTLPHA